MRHTATVLALMVFFSSAVSSLGAEETRSEPTKKFLTAKALLKTKAGQSFITRKYTEALRGFRQLAKQYPEDVTIIRYMGATLFPFETRRRGH